MMEKKFEQAKDLHVRNYVVYGKAADKKLYYDAAYTKQVSKADLEDAFNKGALLIVDGSNKLVPVVLVGNAVKTIIETGTETKVLSFVSWAALAE